ncbi:hypothetical protein CHUAL_008787 [Chamberlinius hualienensis]
MKAEVIISIAILALFDQSTAANTDKLLEIFGLTNEDLGDSLFRQMVENLHDNEIFGHLNETDHGFTLLLTETSSDDDYVQELNRHKDQYAPKYLDHHIILHRYSLEDLAKQGIAVTIGGTKLHFKEYRVGDGGTTYTVNGIECTEGGDLLNPSINVIHLKEPLWFPPSPITTDSSNPSNPFIAHFIKKFVQTCHLPERSFQLFLSHFEKQTNLLNVNEPITYVIPPDNMFKYWCSVVFLNPFIVINQLSQYIFLGPIGPTNINYESFMENMLHEKVLIKRIGNHNFKVLEAMINTENAKLLADGKGYIYPDSSTDFVEPNSNMPFKMPDFVEFFG